MNHGEFFRRFQIRSDNHFSEGVFGKLYLGYDRELGKEIAIKKMEDVEMARREFETMSNYGSHPNLPEAHGICERDGTAYIAMELIEGKLLGHYLFGEQHTEESTRITLISLLSGLDRLHTSGHLHLDIKPENIMIVAPPHLTKLFDFGAAEKKGPNGFWTGVLSGYTWEYCSPEQVFPNMERVVTLNDTADTYAMAGIGLYLLRGQAPVLPDFTKFGDPRKTGESSQEYRAECLRLKRNFPNSEAKTQLEQILFKGMDPRIEERFQSAREFATTLQTLRD